MKLARHQKTALAFVPSCGACKGVTSATMTAKRQGSGVSRTSADNSRKLTALLYCWRHTC
ncbi:hypothetical protein PF003_g23105 [Phytophthora fragariae]|nr:hypothetical protein PF003_g23105 [Phytophthora fragariae]